MSGLHGCTHGWKDAEGNATECIVCVVERLTDELATMNRRRESNEAQLVQIAQYIGKDARHAPDEDRSIAGIAIAELKRLTRERDEANESRDIARQAVSNAIGECNRLRRELAATKSPEVCTKHRENPARVYHSCIGCELDYLRAQIEALTAANQQMSTELDEAKSVARQLLGRTETFADENEFIAKHPWLEYHA